MFGTITLFYFIVFLTHDIWFIVLDGFISDDSKEQERKYSTSFEDFHVSLSLSGMTVIVSCYLPLVLIIFNLSKCAHCFLSARLRRSTLLCPWKIIWYQVGEQAYYNNTYNRIVTLLTVILLKSGHRVPTLRPLTDLRVCAPGRWSQSIWEPSKFWIVKSHCKSLSLKQQMHSERPFTRSVWRWACVVFVKRSIYNFYITTWFSDFITLLSGTEGWILKTCLGFKYCTFADVIK